MENTNLDKQQSIAARSKFNTKKEGPAPEKVEKPKEEVKVAPTKTQQRKEKAELKYKLVADLQNKN